MARGEIPWSSALNIYRKFLEPALFQLARPRSEIAFKSDGGGAFMSKFNKALRCRSAARMTIYLQSVRRPTISFHQLPAHCLIFLPLDPRNQLSGGLQKLLRPRTVHFDFSFSSQRERGAIKNLCPFHRRVRIEKWVCLCKNIIFWDKHGLLPLGNSLSAHNVGGRAWTPGRNNSGCHARYWARPI